MFRGDAQSGSLTTRKKSMLEVLAERQENGGGGCTDNRGLPRSRSSLGEPNGTLLWEGPDPLRVIGDKSLELGNSIATTSGDHGR